MAIGHLRSPISPPPSTVELHSKFTKLVYRHEQLKISYQQLNSQVNSDLLQAAELFAPLAIPLTKLVGLKTVEMVNDGQFSTIIIDDDINHMCNHMVEYVKGLKDDMKNGTCMRLLAMVDEMEKKMKDVRVELEDARKKVRLAEEGKIEAVCKLNETIERVRKMKEQLSSLPEAKRGLIKSSFSQKVHSLDSSILYSRAFDLN
ncbi:unnamed protein product [Dovyalis caffra]|uniref:Uncharacterized protein n=1 Tax=Dovyalis caffra TaxID=77055 RepID=A0AAV1RK74_9ROSI|nr:unnamed protein product [Dovyalis caffra]